MSDSLTAAEAAARARVTGRTLRRWISSGQLTATRTPGGQLRIDPADLDRALGMHPTTSAEVE